MKIKLNFLLIFSFLSMFLISCDKEQEEYVPYVYVNFTIDLSINNNLATPGYSLLVPQAGYGGIIIYCEYYDFVNPDLSIYHAYDACCTNEITSDCTLTNEGNSFYGVCTCCGSKFELITGYPVEGDAPYPLKEYNIGIFNNKVLVKN